MALKIAFNIEGDRLSKLTGGALLAMEKRIAGETVPYSMKLEYMACFMADGNRKLLGREKAMAILINEREPEIDAAFGELMEALNKKAVPPQNGKPSSEPSKMDAASPVGTTH